MKLSYTVGMPDTKGPMFAYQGDLSRIIEELKAIGYDGIEPFVRNPKEIDLKHFLQLVERTGLEVPVIGTAPILEDKLSLTDASAEIRAAAITRVKEIIDFAAACGAKAVSIGKSRGNFPSDQKDLGWQWLLYAMQEICGHAESKKISITIEPQNKMNINNINTTREGLRWIESTGLNNLFIILDTYHMYVEDQSIAAGLVEAGSRIGHMHFADSNRGFPGKGSINFIEVMRVLKAIGYSGYLSLEIAQQPDGYTAAKKSWEYLNFVRENCI